MTPWLQGEADAPRGLAARCRRISAGVSPSLSDELESTAREHESHVRFPEGAIPQHRPRFHRRVSARRHPGAAGPERCSMLKARGGNEQ